MKARVFCIALFSLTSMLAGCTSDEDIRPKESHALPIVWKVERELKGLALRNYLFNDWVIQGVDDGAGTFHLMAISADSGGVVWVNKEWSDALTPWDIQDSDVEGNLMVLSNNTTTMVVNLSNGKTVWSSEMKGGQNNVCIIDGWVYKAGVSYEHAGSTMYRYDIRTGKRESVFTITRKEQGDNLYTPYLMLPVRWVSPSGDEILVMHNRSYGGGTNEKDRMDVLAFNITADTMLWYRKGVDESSSSSRPAISGDQVYFYGTWHAYSIDAGTGKVNWSYDVGVSTGGDFNTANILVVEDMVIVKQENYRMTAVDKNTGEKIWYNAKTAPMPYLLRACHDTIWMASGGLLAIDANNGDVLFDWNNDGVGVWINPILPHPTNGKIYTTDGSYLYCLDPKGF